MASLIGSGCALRRRPEVSCMHTSQIKLNKTACAAEKEISVSDHNLF